MICVCPGDDTDINANNTNEDKQPNYFQDSHHISMHETSTTDLVPLTIYPTETDLQYIQRIIRFLKRSSNQHVLSPSYTRMTWQTFVHQFQ